ncbi:MAG: NADH-quinone oxidoreductase subunit C [Planctomycetes bacterium]|nr:NADH-quinone oxidoreductase subunit C [Planctomycetota bacterium]
MSANDFATLRSSQAIARTQIPGLGFQDFSRNILTAAAAGLRTIAYFGAVEDADSGVVLYAVMADNTQSLLHVGKTRLEAESFPSLAEKCPQVHLFEREIAEQYGVRPESHPWFKPVRFHHSYRQGHDAWGRKQDEHLLAGVIDFYRVEGEEIHEVAVGPVHAGVIEPGHFRFQCHGEQVYHLEISLGYQHRGVERSLVGGPDKRTLHTMETLSGDTSVGHALAYCEAVEALTQCQAPIRAEVIRGVALELERLANHTGDLGALAGDVGFLPTASYCGRLRGDFLNLTALLCGNRFGRSLIRPGGLGFDLSADQIKQCLERLEAAYLDVANASNLLWDASSVQARFEHTGAITQAVANSLGMVGPAARATGMECDARRDFPSGIFRFAQIPVSTWTTGDVFARAYVRWLEIQRSVAFIKEQLQALPDGPIREPVGALKPDQFVVTLVEGWRGEICHVAMTDAQGRFSRYKVVDPSFHNWMGLAMALREQQISDFPLCNKSFNLSYCGHDL